MKFGKLSLISALLMIFLLVGACESGDTVDTGNMPLVEQPDELPVPEEPAVDETPDLEEILLQAEERTREVRGLSAPGEPIYKFSASEEFMETVAALVREDESLTFSEGIVYKLLGLLANDVDYLELNSDLYSGGVAGFYTEGEIQVNHNPGDELTFATLVTYVHEYVHYLQDLAFNIEDYLDELESPDINRAQDIVLAYLALAEGDATFSEEQFLTEYGFDYSNLSDDFPGLSPEAAQIVGRLGPDHPVLTRLSFPYVDGAEFVGRFFGDAENGYEAINELYSNPPVSTEQILHPEFYPNHTPVELPDKLIFDFPGDWLTITDVSGAYGELFIRSWLTTLGSSPDRAEAAARGWGNDSLKLLSNGSDEYALQWNIVWDDPETDAVELADALSYAIARNNNPAAPIVAGVAIESNSCGADGNLSWVTDSGVLVHRTQNEPGVGDITAIAVASDCETALELLPSEPIYDLEILLSQVESQVRDIRGLDAPEESIYTLTSDEEFVEMLSESIADNTQAEEGEVYKLLGTLAADVDFVKLFSDLFGGGVAGFYSDDQIEVRYNPGDEVSRRFIVTYAHEYVHYLQDRNFNIQDVRSGLTDEEAFAYSALVEGDATLSEEVFDLAYNFDYAHLSDASFGFSSEFFNALQSLGGSSHLILDLVYFPYVQGTQFVKQVYANGGNDYRVVNELYSNPPISTEQILHPELYPNEVAVELADDVTVPPSGWETVEYLSGAYGEFFILSWLETLGTTKVAASSAAAGWGNDYLALLRSDDDADELAILWTIAWDDPATDTLEFAIALIEAIITQIEAIITQVSAPAVIVNGLTIESTTCGADDNISWKADTGVLVHQVQDDLELDKVTKIAIAPSCEAALELLDESN